MNRSQRAVVFVGVVVVLGLIGWFLVSPLPSPKYGDFCGTGLQSFKSVLCDEDRTERMDTVYLLGFLTVLAVLAGLFFLRDDPLPHHKRR